MDVTNLTSLVTALRAETAYAAITPESLGALLQRIVDAIEMSAYEDDMKVVKNWKNDLLQIAGVLTAAEQGSADRNNIYLTTSTANLATGATATSTDAIIIKQATTDRAGAMRAQQVIDLNTCKSDIKNIQSDLRSYSTELTSMSASVNALKKKVENLPSSGSSPSLSSASAYNIVTDVRNDVLHVRGANNLLEAGYKPFIFRYSLKRNRLTNKETGERYRGPKRRGWHMIYGTDIVSVGEDDSILFANRDGYGKPYGFYGTTVWNIITTLCHVDLDNDITDNIKVSWGKKSVNATKGRRFKLGIAFALPQNKQGFDHSTLVTNIAEFHAYVRVDKLTGKPLVTLCL